MIETRINNTFTADNIPTACTNPNDVTFDLWNDSIRTYTAKGVNATDAYREELMGLEETAIVLKAAGMAYILTADNSDPRGYPDRKTATAESKKCLSLDPMVLTVEEWLGTIME